MSILFVLSNKPLTLRLNVKSNFRKQWYNIQQTRFYDPMKNESNCRDKEEANDYRYFPDSDLIAGGCYYDAYLKMCKKPYLSYPCQTSNGF